VETLGDRAFGVGAAPTESSTNAEASAFLPSPIAARANSQLTRLARGERLKAPPCLLARRLARPVSKPTTPDVRCVASARAASTSPWSGESEQTGSAWQRQPPESIARRSQLRQGWGIQDAPRKACRPGELDQIRLAPVLHVPEGEPSSVCGAAREHQPVGADDHEPPTPAVHEGGRVLGIVVGHDEHDLHPGCGCDGPRAPELGAVGSSARRFSSAQPRYCALASSAGRREAPRRARSPRRCGRVPRWRTVLTVSGNPSSFTERATSSLRSNDRSPAMASTPLPRLDDS